jgi:hypothetical protein
MKKTVNSKLHLWWFNPKTNKRFHAGLAYFNERKGDYSLILSSLELSYKDKKPFEIFLRPIQTSASSIYYRMEKIIYCKGRVNRLTVGEAFFNENTDGEIHMTFEPYTSSEKKLVLTLTNQQEKKLCA